MVGTHVRTCMLCDRLSHMTKDIINFKMADSIVCNEYDRSFRRKLWITMVKTHCVIITAQVDMNLIVICERIMELQLSKKMNQMNLMMNES